MKTILVSTVPEETRVAIVADGELLAVEVERETHSHLVGNIYKGQIQNVLPGMQAAFVDIGAKKNAFMYIGNGVVNGEQDKLVEQGKVHIGQRLPVQIVKDAIGTKGPRATTHLSLPGRNVVLMPTAAYIGMSRRITDETERSRLKEIAEAICPEGMGLIIRTAAVGKSREVLEEDVRCLVRLWESILAKNKTVAAPMLLYRDADLIIRVVRDYLTDDVDRMIVDNGKVYQRVTELLDYILPEYRDRVELYEGRLPLFKEFHIDEEIEKLGAREVELKSGGFIVIDRTEALTVIDVNTGKYIGRSNLAETVYRINMEAAAEILKQLRLRDIGGIIVVDFIDMDNEERKESLLSFLRENVKHDRTKTNIVDITSLGLVEITRKKSRQNLESIIYSECPCCQGRGRIESPETVAIKISRDIRRIEAKSHAAFGYEVEVHEKVAEAIYESGILEGLAKEMAIDIRLSSQVGIHPECYSIIQLGN